MSENPYNPPKSNIIPEGSEAGLAVKGRNLFAFFWFSIYALLLIWGYYSSIHTRQEYPLLANNELHPLRIALNETVAIFPILVLEPWFGFLLGKGVANRARKYWALAIFYALLMGIVQGLWVVVADLLRRWVTGHPTGNESMYALMSVLFFVLTFIVVSVVHGLLGFVLRFRWARLPNQSFNSDPAATI